MSRFDMEREFLKKLESEEPLSAAEVFRLEELLEAEASSQVADMVVGLPDVEPSMAWRSELNLKLGALRPDKKVVAKAWWRNGWMVGGVSVVAASMALFVFAGFPLVGGKAVVSDPMVATNGSVAPPDGIVGDTDDLSLVLVRAHEVAEVEASSGIQVPRRSIEPGYDWESLGR